MNVKYFLKFFSIYMFFYSCSEPIKEPKTNIMSGLDFSFQQEKDILYFGVRVIPEYNLQELNNVSVDWYGSNKDNSPFNFKLFDNGLNGDILEGDGLYSRKIANNIDSLVYPIGQTAPTDSNYANSSIIVYMNFIANHGSDSTFLLDSFIIGNIIPEIIEIYAPDTIRRPEGATVSFELISAKAFDAENNINWVGFTSYSIDDSSMMNNGNYIYLYDDGSSIVLYEPDFTSGDELINDGIFSFRIPIYGNAMTDTTLQTKTGEFKWEFITQDEAGEYSKIREHHVFIQ